MRHRVLLVEDEHRMRGHLAAAVRSRAELELVGEAGSVTEGRRLLAELRPDVLLTDLGLPDGRGIELIQACRALPGALPIVVTVFGDDAHVVEAIHAGALGYLLKSDDRMEVGDAILEMLAGGSPMTPSIARAVLGQLRQPAREGAVQAEDLPALSDREMEVLRSIVKGFTYSEIGEILQISRATVATHVRKIYGKLSVHSRGEAAYEALQLGLVGPDD